MFSDISIFFWQKKSGFWYSINESWVFYHSLLSKYKSKINFKWLQDKNFMFIFINMPVKDIMDGVEAAEVDEESDDEACAYPLV